MAGLKLKGLKKSLRRRQSHSRRRIWRLNRASSSSLSVRPAAESPRCSGMIAGLEEITGGTLEIDGMVVNDVPPSKRGIAMVFQSYCALPAHDGL